MGEVRAGSLTDSGHPFLLVKRYFGFCKLVYKGLKKNGSRLFSLFASANILMCARAGRLGRSHA